MVTGRDKLAIVVHQFVDVVDGRAPRHIVGRQPEQDGHSFPETLLALVIEHYLAACEIASLIRSTFARA